MENRSFSPIRETDENGLNKKTSRRAFTVTALGGLGAVLSGCGPKAESNPVSDGQVALAEEISHEETDQTEPTQTEQPIVRLGIDINALPHDDIYADREERSPERLRELLENSPKEFDELLQTKKHDVLTNGEFDVEKAGRLFVEKLEAALNFRCSRDDLVLCQASNAG